MQLHNNKQCVPRTVSAPKWSHNRHLCFNNLFYRWLPVGSSSAKTKKKIFISKHIVQDCFLSLWLYEIMQPTWPPDNDRSARIVRLFRKVLWIPGQRAIRIVELSICWVKQRKYHLFFISFVLVYVSVSSHHIIRTDIKPFNMNLHSVEMLAVNTDS